MSITKILSTQTAEEYCRTHEPQPDVVLYNVGDSPGAIYFGLSQALNDMGLYYWSSEDGLNWKCLNAVAPAPLSKSVGSSMAVIRHRGRYTLACVTGPTTSPTIDVYTSLDLCTWALEKTLTPVAGANALVNHVSFFVDNDDSLHLLCCACVDSTASDGTELYCVYDNVPGDADDLTAAWTAAAALTGLSAAYDVKQAILTRRADTYYLCYCQNFYVQYASATVLTGTYTDVEIGDWMAWGLSGTIFEGLVVLPDGRFRFYAREGTGSVYYIDTSDNTWDDSALSAAAVLDMTPHYFMRVADQAFIDQVFIKATQVPVYGLLASLSASVDVVDDGVFVGADGVEIDFTHMPPMILRALMADLTPGGTGAGDGFKIAVGTVANVGPSIVLSDDVLAEKEITGGDPLFIGKDVAEYAPPTDAFWVLPGMARITDKRVYINYAGMSDTVTALRTVSVNAGGTAHDIGDELTLDAATTGMVVTAVVLAAGTGYTVGDELVVAGVAGTGCTVRVLTITGVDPTGPIDTIQLLTHGSLYTAETCAVMGGTGNDDATIDVTVSDHQAVVTVTEICDDPGGLGELLTLGALTGGSGYAEAEDVATSTDGDGEDATVDIVSIIDGSIATVSLGAGGLGYEAEDVLTVDDGTDGTVTVLTATDLGQADGVALATGGEGYTVADGKATTGGTGEGATVDVDTLLDGVIATVSVGDGGEGYEPDDVLTVGQGTDGTVKVLTAGDLDVVDGIGLTTGGSGYTVADGKATTGGTGTGATVDVDTKLDGVITTHSLGAEGSGYSPDDVLTVVQAGGSLGTVTVLSIGTGGKVVSYELTTGGIGYSVEEDVVTTYLGAGTGFKLDIDSVTNGIVDSVSLGAGGAGYTDADVLTVVQEGASGCTVTVTSVDPGGAVLAVEVVAGGYGYTVADNKATTGGSGTDCEIDVDTIYDDVVETVSLGDGGAGYEVNDVLTVVEEGASGCTITVTAVTGGVVQTIEVAAGGYGYTVGDGQSTTGGGGTGCEVDVDSVTDGIITAVAINNPGTKYAAADTLTIVQEGGTGGEVVVATANNFGAVTAVEITDPGLGYEIDTAIPTTSNAEGSGCAIDVVANCAGTVTMDFEVSIIADPL